MWSAGRSILLSCWICVLLLVAGCAAAFRLTPLGFVAPSVIRISATFEDSTGSCTAFSVNETPGRWITAAHCAAGDVTVGSLVFRPLEIDAEHDLALLETPHGLPPLLLGPQPVIGDSTLSVGYPLHAEKLVGVPSLYQGVFRMWPEDTIPFAIFSGNSMPGMSGGPILDRQGRVVSVVLGGGNPAQAYQNVGFGVPYAALRKLTMKWQIGADHAVSIRCCPN
jgi:S1-C subfamily serine protease